jgi:hypothetical protein
MAFSVSARVDPAQFKILTDLLKELFDSRSVVAHGTREDPVHVVFESSDIVDAIGKVADALTILSTPPPVSGFHFEGGGFMRTYAEDRAPDTFTFTKPKVVDSEGGVLSPQPELNYTFSSDDEGIVSIVDNGDGTVTTTYKTARQLEDGSFAIAEVRAESNEISLADGSTIKDVKTEQVQLVTGVAAGFAGGGFNFPDAAPAPPATPAPVDNNPPL